MTEYKYKEIINKYALMYVLNHADKYELGKDALYIGGSLTRDKDSILTLYNKYLNRLVLDDIDTGKSYIENRYKRRGDCARLWSVETSLTNISRRLRHTIAREYNIDIDIKNCHPVFLQYFAKNNGLDTPCLDFYIENRDEVIQNILTYFPDKEKDDIKKQLLSVINRGDVYLKHDFIYAFSNECKDIESKICEIKPKLYEKIKKQKDFNPEGSVINLMLCEMEDNALNVMIKIIECEGLKITSLAYDGLTIERTDCDLSSVLGKCEDAIYEQLGVRVRVVEKEMNQYLDLPEDYKKQLFGKCKCLLEHHKYHTIINLFKDIFNVHIYCVDFLKIISFLYNTMSPGCYIRLSSSIISGLDRFNESHLDSVYNISGLDHTLDWKWVLRFIPKSKQYLLLIEDINEIIRTQSSSSDCIVNTSFDSKKFFEPDDDIYDLILRYRQTVFESYESMIDDWQKNIDKYLKFIVLPKCMVINRGDYQLEIVPKVEINTRFWGVAKKERVILTCKCEDLIDDLNVSGNMPIYKNITFNPDLGNMNEKEFNMYNGIQAQVVDQVDMNKITPILHHIKTCWANDNDDIYDYIIHWFRHCFLKPWEKTGIVILLHGIEGTGKGILIDNLIIPYIYGDNLACVSQGLTPITQRFNSICMNKLFICCNEVSSEGGFHMSFEKLKAIITDKTISIEKKGIDIFKDYPNYINFIFTTNNTDSVKLGKTDRRYCCLDTSSRYKGDYDYFDMLLAYCNQETANHFYTYCIRYEKTRNIRNIPMTNLKKDMLLNATTSVEKFIEDVRYLLDNVTDETLSSVFENEYKWDDYILSTRATKTREITSRTLYSSYTKWCSENNETRKSKTLFGREAKKFTKQKRTKKDRLFLF